MTRQEAGLCVSGPTFELMLTYEQSGTIWKIFRAPGICCAPSMKHRSSARQPACGKPGGCAERIKERAGDQDTAILFAQKSADNLAGVLPDVRWQDGQPGD